jgi:hypothetical protein
MDMLHQQSSERVAQIEVDQLTLQWEKRDTRTT